MKEISIGKRRFTIQSLGGTDQYEPVIRDGFGDDLWRFAAAQLDPHSVVIDIGANIGLTSCLFSQLAARVHAFEPNPQVYGLLETNIAGNRLANVQAHRLALGDAAGSMAFEGVSAFGRLSRAETGVTVEVRTLDDMVDRLQLSRVDLVKIDVEGFEPNVLRGALRTLERFNPILVMEFNSWTLMAYGDVNPLGFARELVRDFAAVHFLQRAPAVQVTDPLGLTYVNLIEHRCVSDVVLLRRARPLAPPLPAAIAAPVPAAVKPEAAPQLAKRRDRPAGPSVADLQKQLDAMRRSTSWRITAPLRALRRLWR